MKKILSVLLLLAMLFAAVMPMALAEETLLPEDGGANAPTDIEVQESKPILSMTVTAKDRNKDLYKGKVVTISVTVTNESQQAVTDFAILNNVTDDVWKPEKELPAGKSKTFTLKYTFMKDADSQEDKKEDNAASLKDEKIEFKANIGDNTVAEAFLTLSPYRNPLTIMESLGYMLKGMVGIFLVTGLIILVLVIMDKAGNRKKETEE